MFFTIFLDAWLGKTGIPTKPEKLEPTPVTPYYRVDEFQNAVGGMDVPGSQFGAQAVTFTGEAKKRMETALTKWPL
jgi:hypothetical protein